MGFLNTVKGWLNIGGVSCKLQGVSQRVSRSGNLIEGRVLLTSKGDKQVLSLRYQFVMKHTSGPSDKRESKELIIAETVQDEPFEMTEGETKTVEFTIPYRIEPRLRERGGFFGAIGQMTSLVADEREDYFIRAMCDVKGTALDPGDRIEVVLVD
jgi:hypothetical protein